MDGNVTFQNDIVDLKSSLPTPHLSFIIQLLLPKRLVGFQRAERQQQNFQEVTAKDPQMADGFFSPLMVGSSSEGYNIPDAILRSNTFGVQTHTDADILLVVPALPVVTSYNLELNATEEDRKKLLLDVQNVHDGYARLQILTPKDNDDTFVFLEETNKTYLSGTKLQKKIFTALNLQKMMLHGPALSLDTPEPPTLEETLRKEKRGIHAHDYVLALPCKQWPNVARSWEDRHRCGDWLDNEIVDKIVNMGVHLVPVPHRHSSHPDLEWRISFAMSEYLLAKNVITDYQRQCYVFLKIIHYVKLKPLDILTSYHLKSIFLYTCEKLPQNAWKENPGSCLLFLIDSIIECVNRKLIPSFFIPKNNLIDHFSDEQATEILSILQDIRENPLAPVLEFTDTKVMGMQSLTTPFRDIIEPVLKDSVDFLNHHDIQKSVTAGFLPALFKMVYVLILEQKPQEAVKYIIDVFPAMSKFSGGGVSVAYIIDSIAMNFVPDIQLTIDILEEVIKYSDEYPDVLMLRGNLACMFHALAYKHPEDSDERMLALVQAETLFNTVVDVEDIYSATAVDFCWLLFKQKRFDEAAEKLDRFIAAELGREGSTHCFYKKEISVLDDILQKEAEEHGKLAVSSLSMAYYLLVHCVVKDNLSSADPVVYDKVLQYFKQHCQKINTSMSYSLLGYCYITTHDWTSALKAFCKARELCEGSVKRINENISRCENYILADKNKET